MNNLYASLEDQYKLPKGTLDAIVGTERSGDTQTSPKGAKGRFQFMPETAKAYGVNPEDPISSAHGAAKYISDLAKEYGSIQAAVAHYNGGGVSAKAILAGNPAPYDETRKYLTSFNSKLSIDPQDEENAILTSGKVTVSGASLGIDPSDEVPKKAIDTSTMSNPELFKSGLVNSAKTTMAGVGQALDPLALQLEKSFNKMQQETGGNTRRGRFMEQLQKTFGTPTAEEVALQRPEEIRNIREENKAINQTNAGLAGNVVGDIGQAVVLPGGTLVKTGLSGMALGAAQPVTEGESRIANAVGGGAAGLLGQAGVNVLGRIAEPVVKNLSKQAEKSIQALKDAGVPLDLAQETGSKVMGWAKRLTSDNPFTGARNQAFEEAQNNAYTRAISKTMGEDAERITPEVLKNAKTRLGDNYDYLFDNNGVRVTRSFQKDLSELRDASEKVMPEGQKGITNIVNDILEKSKTNMGHLDGKQYQAIKQQLSAMEAQGGTAGHYAGELREKLFAGLSDTIEKLGNPKDLELLKITNKQYGNMKKIEDIALKDADGHVSASKLYNSLTTKSKRNSFYQDDPELAKLATAGKSVLPEKMPNSGTIARAGIQAVVPTMLAGAEYLKEGDLRSAAELGLTAYAAPKLLQKALTTQGAAGKYLREGLDSNTLRSLLQAPAKYGVGKLPLAYETQFLQKGKE
jgi:hypothetical protein